MCGSRVDYNCTLLYLPRLRSGRSRSWQREPHASSQQRCSLHEVQWGQCDRQPVPPARQEAQSEEEEMNRVPPEATDSCFSTAVQSVSDSLLWEERPSAESCDVSRDQYSCWLFVWCLTSIKDNLLLSALAVIFICKHSIEMWALSLFKQHQRVIC